MLKASLAGLVSIHCTKVIVISDGDAFSVVANMHTLCLLCPMVS